jgi:signal transduction histidine kinase
MVWCFAGFLSLFGLAVWPEVGALLAGEVTPAFASRAPFFGSTGGAFGAIAGVNRGRATKNRNLTEQVGDQRETLVLLSRLVRHDIRNDMMAIRGHADLLEDHVDAEGESSLATIRRQSDATIRLLQDADTLVGTLDEPGEYEHVHLSTILRDEVASVADNHPAVTVEATIPDDLVVFADGLVHRLFSNLLENAVAHDDPATLTVRLEATHEGDTGEVVVADDGAGVPPEVREHCFELGEQGPDSDGDGLGLYIVSRLADVYGGSVSVGESPEGGARFDVSLPAADRS